MKKFHPNQIEMVYTRCKNQLSRTIRLAETFNLCPALATQTFSGGGEYGPLAYLAEIAKPELFSASELQENEKPGLIRSFKGGFHILYCTTGLCTTSVVARPRNWACCNPRRFIGVDSTTGLAFFRMDDNCLCRIHAETDLHAVNYLMFLAYIIHKSLSGQPCPTKDDFEQVESNVQEYVEKCSLELKAKTAHLSELTIEHEKLLAKKKEIKDELYLIAKSKQLQEDVIRNTKRSMDFLTTKF